MRRLNLSNLHVLTVLDEPVKEKLIDLNVQLFEGDNYIYLVDLIGNKFYAEYVVKNDFTDTYATKIEMNTVINQTAQDIMLQVNKKVDEEEFGTQLQLNSEALKMAWNQISQYLQLEGIQGKASLVIYDKDNQKLSIYDDSGQHFYDGDNIFGEMGVKAVEDEKYISFSVPGDYNQSISNGMAWGMTTTSDNKFWPILFIKNFHMANKNAGDFGGELILNYCDLLLNGLSGIISGNVKIHGDDIAGIFFEEINSGEILLSIIPDSNLGSATIKILNNISFFRNQLGSNSLKLGIGDTCCVLTDEGSITGNHLIIDGDIFATNNISGQSITNRSIEESKKNIKKYQRSAIKEIINTDICTFNYKNEKNSEKKTIGAVISDKYNCSKDILSNNQQEINLYSMISIAWKAIQEQQEQIEELKQQVEKSEQEVANGKN